VTGTAALPPEGGDARQSGHPGGVVFGRFMLADLTEHPCRVSDLSTEGVTFLTDLEVEPRSRLVAYIQDVGRVVGTVVGTVPGGIRVGFQLSGAGRQRLASRLQWHEGPVGSTALRRHRRHPVADGKSHITLADGRTYACDVIDVSLSGAALRTAVLPSLGTLLSLGRMRGRVVRHHACGIAIEFLKVLDRTTLARTITG
jgi:hypothetical protein